MTLRIPEYQRAYAWTPDLALQLFEDLNTAIGPGGSDTAKSWRQVPCEVGQAPSSHPNYVIGSLILHQDQERPKEFNVVDGQQRLLTLLMIKQILFSKDASSQPTSEGTPTESQAHAVRRALQDRIYQLSCDEREACWKVIAQRAEMVVVTTDNLDEAFSVFDAQNTRGRGLDPHDLLKAFHLREMRGASETERAAAVERWEDTDQADLRRLFARYLYRIARWSLGKSGSNFGAQDIDMFKGITSSGARTPIQQYHAAAQALIPAIQQWEARNNGQESKDRDRQLGHARFRLDEPVVAGSLFFEMVDFFLQELRRLRCKTVPVDWNAIFGTGTGDNALTAIPGRSTMLYVSELYLAAMLYAVNRFGDSAISEADRMLRRWAFQPRVEMYTLYEVRIDNMSKQDDSVFRIIRNSQRLGQLLRHPVEVFMDEPGSQHGHEVQRLIFQESGFHATHDAEEENS